MWGDATNRDATNRDTRGETPPPSGDAIELGQLLNDAKSEILLVEPGGKGPWPWSIDIAPLVTGALQRGCRVRVLFGRWPSATPGRLFAHRATEAGAELRAGGTPEQTMMAVDDATALLPSDAAELTVVTQPQVVRMLRSLADVAWSRATAMRIGSESEVFAAAAGVPRFAVPRSAVPRSAVPRSAVPRVAAVDVADTSHRSLQRRIVQLLADGAKDETIARALGMSVRTCRRHIADIMRRLDAVSRFQAGANAVRLGLAGIEAVPRS
ncbi:MAG TPA: helix-turn-helix transcriptional regulator [Micromonosporaceae bacterium]|jgi:DNA-binding CsgD family transcriptional regulator|nr:helix-turn-helix transcriptional regulator [Micromonosporaceae bacterium]